MKNNNTNKLKFNIFLINGVKGFFLAIIPVLITEFEAMIVQKYSIDFLNEILNDVVKLGIIGIGVSLVYTLFSYFYPKISKILYFSIILLYYIWVMVMLIIRIYFQTQAPLLS